MADRVRVQVEGYDRFRRTLRKAGRRLDMQPAHTEVAGLVTTRARPPRLTGQLASSLQPRGLKGSAVVRSTAIYAGPIHYGWPARGIPAQLFATEAAETYQPEWADIYRQQLEKILSTVKGV